VGTVEMVIYDDHDDDGGSHANCPYDLRIKFHGTINTKNSGRASRKI